VVRVSEPIQIAIYFRGKRQIGGRVTVTDRRFLFVPNRLDGLLGGPEGVKQVEAIGS